MKSFNQLRESKNALEDMEILDYILSEMSIDDLEELSEGPFSTVGKFMMKRKLKKQIDKSQKDVRKHNRAIDKARQDAIDKHPPNRDDTIQKAIKKATDPHKPNVQKGVAMRKRSQKALDRLNRPESKPVNADKPKPDLFKSRNR
jgi:hypothetical protein